MFDKKSVATLMQISPQSYFYATIAAMRWQFRTPRLNPARPWIESRTIMNTQPDIHGLAALAICESLLLALNDHNILPEREIIGILRDAAATHKNPPPDTYAAKTHEAVAALINSIIDGGNSVRRR